MKDALHVGLILSALVILALGLANFLTAEKLAMFAAFIMLIVAMVDMVHPTAKPESS